MYVRRVKIWKEREAIKSILLIYNDGLSQIQGHTTIILTYQRDRPLGDSVVRAISVRCQRVKLSGSSREASTAIAESKDVDADILDESESPCRGIQGRILGRSVSKEKDDGVSVRKADTTSQSLVQRLRAIASASGSQSLDNVVQLVEPAVYVRPDDWIIDSHEDEAIEEAFQAADDYTVSAERTDSAFQLSDLRNHRTSDIDDEDEISMFSC